MKATKPRIKKTRYFPLKMLVDRSSQSEVARLLGCSQPNVNRMIRERRAVYVCLHSDGTASAVQLTPCAGTVISPDELHELGNQAIAGFWV